MPLILLLKNSVLLLKVDPRLSTDSRAPIQEVKIQQLALSRSPDTTNALLAGFTMLSNQEITLPLESGNASSCRDSRRKVPLSAQMVAFHVRDPLRIRLELQPLRLAVFALHVI